MIRILKFLRGYVQIKVWGVAPERFLNLCGNKNILLWDIKRDGEIYYMCISLAGFRQLKGIARKTRTRVVIQKRYGLPFLLPEIFARKMFLIGLFAACFFWFWSSFYVWDITIEGNYAITEDVFISFLETEGVKVGVKTKSIDIDKLEKKIRSQFREITWTTAKLSGTTLYIAVKENDGILTQKGVFEAADLHAEKDGRIVSMIVRAGIPQVKIGDSVEMGDLLVSGKIPVYNEDTTVKKYQYTKADADIYVERIREVYETLPFDYIKKEYTGRICKRYSVILGGKIYTLGGKPAFRYYDEFSNTKELVPLKGLRLPVILGVVICREYQNKECSYSLSEAEMLLQKKYSVFLAGLEEKGVQIIEKNVTIDTRSGMWVLKGQLRVREKIGTELPIEME